HPSIVRYVSHGVTDEGRQFLAMEWLEGEDLADRLQRGPLDPADAVTLGRRAAEALAIAHARGVVHRDVKPSNLFLVAGDVARVKVLDFGIARIPSGAQAPTRTGNRVGTPRYMSPEQVRGVRGVDARADVFALGCVLFACLTGRAAFTGTDELAVL